MAEECTAASVASRESQVAIQCKRLAELSSELHIGLQGLEKRLEPALSPAPPTPDEAKDAASLCPLANALRQTATELESQLKSVRALIDRLEV